MSPRPRNPGSKHLPINLYSKLDKRTGNTYYQWRDPRTGRFHSFGTDEQQAIIDAQGLNAAIYDAIRTTKVQAIQAQSKSGPSLSSFLLDYWRIIGSERDLKPNTVRTKANITGMIGRAIGELPVSTIGVSECAALINRYRDQGKDRMAQSVRSTLVDIFKVAISEGHRTDNPAEATRNPQVKVRRERLTLEQYSAILKAAREHMEPWLANSMQLALHTGQRREDIALLKFRSVIDGSLEVIQEKTGAKLRIWIGLKLEATGQTIAEVISACRDNVVSPYMVHHVTPYGNAPPGAKVHKDTISRAFAKARDLAGIELGEHPPTFHEIRSLSGRLYKAQGMDAQPLLGHKDSRMTDTYLDSRGHDWTEVK